MLYNKNMSNTRKLDSAAIMYIRSRATEYLQNASSASEYERFKICHLPEYQNAYCFAKATVDYLFSHEILVQPIDFIDQTSKACPHNIEIKEKRTVCPQCGTKLKLMWVAEDES